MDDFLSHVWDFIWMFFTIFVFVAWLIALFSIIVDLFRDRELSGWAKAVWLLFLMFVPFLTALIYLIARGRGMAGRSVAQARAQQDAADSYIRSVAGGGPVGGPATEIAKAKELLDAGSITQTEFDSLKAKALA
ncbi:MAG: PLDc N-terminal domain-containing protein [Intrasporangium sp.]|uniref:SHOCT domain-containing protein n=1 Tax=Intrasporangium sp. TaxID=1925024 RepID=UPI002649351D|nr:PLDc N-terminal domain-containing protein [Intrasporangium sp.]MDN5797872.1 PLDc N-terminal domain-containing protein [Intrasporangium sp.]